LITRDEYAASATAIDTVFGTPVPRSRHLVRGALRSSPRQTPGELVYATVYEEREKNRVVTVRQTLVLGDLQRLVNASAGSGVSRAVNTSLAERYHATDRGRNARKAWKTYQFSKDWRGHEAMTSFTKYSYNFCWVVRMLRQRREGGRWRRRTPAMAAGSADHAWSLRRWLSFPTVQ
jgi:hypothetical protein